MIRCLLAVLVLSVSAFADDYSSSHSHIFDNGTETTYSTTRTTYQSDNYSSSRSGTYSTTRTNYSPRYNSTLNSGESSARLDYNTSAKGTSGFLINYYGDD